MAARRKLKKPALCVPRARPTKLKTAICLTSVLTFSFIPTVWANFSEKGWLYHGPAGDQIFEKCGGDLGSPLVSVQEIAKVYKLKLKGKKDFILRAANKNEIKFSLRSVAVVGKGWTAELSQAPQKIKKKFCVPLDFGDRALTPLLSGVAPSPWNEHLTYAPFAQVVLDPGHGGNDWGALGVYKGEALKEKDLTLDFAKEFQSALKEKNVEAVLTRNKDRFVALTERYRVANQLNPKLFISLHMNSNGVAPGFEIFTLSLFKRDRQALTAIGRKITHGKENALLTFKSAAKQELSLNWAAAFKEVLGRSLKAVNAGLRREPFFLLYAVDSPAVLVELGSMDKEEDLKLWLSPQLRQSVWKQLSEKVKAMLSAGPK